jgi:hypothetical protein
MIEAMSDATLNRRRSLLGLIIISAETESLQTQSLPALEQDRLSKHPTQQWCQENGETGVDEEPSLRSLVRACDVILLGGEL